MTLGVLWDYIEGTLEVKLGVDWGDFVGNLRSLWMYVLDYFWGHFEGTLGALWFVPWGHFGGTLGVTFVVL